MKALRASAKPRLAAIAVVMGFAAAGAIAQTAPASQPTLAEAWVGTWTGKVTWKECSLETGAALTLPIQALNSTLTSDGDLLYEGLGAVIWSPSGANLVVSREGVELSLAPAKKGAVKLRMTTQSGCLATATLKRATSGMPSCDAVRALATVKSTCDGLDEATRDDELEAVDGAWKGWKKLKGKKKKAQAKRCTAQLSGLRTDTASCAVVGGGAIIAGGACGRMLAMYTAFANCSALPAEARKSILDALPLLQQQVPNMDDATCQSLVDQMAPTMTSMGCAP